VSNTALSRIMIITGVFFMDADLVLIKRFCSGKIIEVQKNTPCLPGGVS
jgi:hypothetical protein